MDKKIAHTKAGSNRKADFKDNSAANQRAKILNWLKEHGSITTTEARLQLDVMSPAARVMELKRRGHQIVLIWDIWVSKHGIRHRIGRYVLVQQQPVNAI